jgi:hypothetical protein
MTTERNAQGVDVLDRGNLIARIQQALNELQPPKMTEARAEYWKAGARAAIAAVNAALAKFPEPRP